MELGNTIIGFWEKYGATIVDIARKFGLAILIIIGGKIITSISKKLTQKAILKKLHADETISAVIKITIQYGVVIICLIMILDIFGVNTTGLLALLGAAGVAVGFSLRDTLANIAAGIIILFLRPFKKDDFIECGSVLGVIKEIGLFSTIMETGDGIYISAPNSNLWGVPLKNYSHNKKRRMEISITISHTDSIDNAFRILKDIINAERRFLKDPQAQVLVQSIGETGTGISLRAWASTDVYWNVYWDQMKNIKEKIQEAGFTIALPRREIQLANGANILHNDSTHRAGSPLAEKNERPSE